MHRLAEFYEGHRPVQILGDEAIQEMLQPDEPQPEPVREEEPWDQFMARQRAQEAMRVAAEVNRIRHDRVQMGIEG